MSQFCKALPVPTYVDGILDWPAIITAAQRGGVVWGIVEQDICAGDPIDSLRTSLANWRSFSTIGTFTGLFSWCILGLKEKINFFTFFLLFW